MDGTRRLMMRMARSRTRGYLLFGLVVYVISPYLLFVAILLARSVLSWSLIVVRHVRLSNSNYIGCFIARRSPSGQQMEHIQGAGGDNPSSWVRAAAILSSRSSTSESRIVDAVRAFDTFCSAARADLGASWEN